MAGKRAATTSRVAALKARGDTEQAQRAWRAVRKMNEMLPMLNSFARAATRNNKVQVVIREGVSCTDGKTIYLRPRIEMGDVIQHDRLLCSQRDPDTSAMLCEACAQHEGVVEVLIHEIAHIVFETFESVKEEDRVEIIRRAIAEMPSMPGTRIAKLQKLVNGPDFVGRGYMTAASLVSPYLPLLVNALEDARVNKAMMAARAGTYHMFRSKTIDVFKNGLTGLDGVTKRWDEMDSDSQAIIGMYVKASGLDYRGWFSPSVTTVLDDPQLTMLARTVATASSAASIYRQAFPILERLRELGRCKRADDMQDDPPPPPPPPPSMNKDPEDRPTENNDDAQGDDDEPKENGDGGDDDRESEDHPDDDPGQGDDSDTEEVDGDDADTSDDQGADDDSVEGGDDVEDASDLDGDDESGGDDDELDWSDDDDDMGDDPSGVDQDATEDQDDDDSASEDGTADDVDDDDEHAGDEESGDDDLDADDGDGSDDLDGDDESGDGEQGDDDGASADDADDDREDSGDADDSGDSDEASADEEDAADGSGGTDADTSGDDGQEDDGYENAGDVPGMEDADDEPESDPGEVEAALKMFGGHDESDEPDPTDMAEIDRAIIQSEVFDGPSRNVAGVNMHYWDTRTRRSHDLAWHGADEPYFSADARIEECKAPESMLGRALFVMRKALAENAKGKKLVGQRSGRIVSNRLASVPTGNDKVFSRALRPGKRDYFAVLALDCSGSTSWGGRNILIRQMGMAFGDLLSRCGVKFSVFGHTCDDTPNLTKAARHQYGGTVDLDIFMVKDVNEQWDVRAKTALAALQGSAANLDGHALEFCRKQCDRSNATDKIIFYVTDGEMPAENAAEEHEILLRELDTCRRKGYTVIGIGIHTDSPRKYGLETIRVDSHDDIMTLIQYIKEKVAS